MHLLAAITAHGFGHAAQLVPVLNALRQRMPALRLSVQTTLTRELLAVRLAPPFELHARAADFGMLMHSALAVDAERSAAAYQEFHADWDARVAREAEWLAALAPDAVLADVPYLTLAAAAKAGIPAYALCSLNWADVYRHYFATRPEAPRILAQMEAAYQCAREFLAPAPSMPMPAVLNRRDIGPIAMRGKNRRAEIFRRLKLSGDMRLVLVAPGGIPTELPMAEWPVIAGVRWLVPAAWNVSRPDVTWLESLQLPFLDVLCSSAVLLGKCGYGTVAECACNGVPMLYVRRPDWPEEETLSAWLREHGSCAPLSPAQLARGELRAPLAQLWQQPEKTPPEPEGIETAAEWLAQCLGG